MSVIRLWAACAVTTSALLLSGCAPTLKGPVGISGEKLVGLSKERLHACAGQPLRDIPQPGSTLLVFYREAAIFEESFVGGKGSKPGYHHGCWATLLLEDDRVTGVEFRPVPDPEADTHECQAIFAACGS